MIVLHKYQFPEGEILWRNNGQSYADIAEKLLPDILIEDNCESIGGKSEMTITKVKDAMKKMIKSVVVKEFEAQVDARARYVKIEAKNYGLIPQWHDGAGGKAWIFIDEITVE